MLDASRELSEARRFRSRIVALTLAENGIELAATQMVVKPGGLPPVADEQGVASGTLQIHSDGQFELLGSGRSKGRESTTASVRLEGKIIVNHPVSQPVIYFSRHTQ